MKSLPNAVSDPDLRLVESEVLAQIRTLFGRCPELTGFSLQDRIRWPEDDPSADEEIGLCITAVGLSEPVSPDEQIELYSRIDKAISELLSERPEAFELLRGRTFARTLH